MVPPPKKQKPEDPMVIAARAQQETGEFMNIYYPRNADDSLVLTDMQMDNHGFPWVAATQNALNDDGEVCISISIVNHMNLQSDCWFCSAELSLLATNTINERKSMLITRLARFTPGSEMFEFQNLFIKEDFVADAGWFPENNVCHIVLQVKVLTINGQKFLKKLSFNWSDEMSGSDICIIVEGKKFFLGKHILVRHTQFFDSMFYGSFKEAGMETIELKEICKLKFEKFLNYTHRVGDIEMCREHVWDLVELAHRFNAQGVMLDAERYMMRSNDIEPYERVIMGDVYQLEALKEQALQMVNNVTQVRLLTGSEYFDELKKETQDIVRRKQDELLFEQQRQLQQQQFMFQNGNFGFAPNNGIYNSPVYPNHYVQNRGLPPVYPPTHNVAPPQYVPHQGYGNQGVNNFAPPVPAPAPVPAAFGGNNNVWGMAGPPAPMGPPPMAPAPQQNPLPVALFNPAVPVRAPRKRTRQAKSVALANIAQAGPGFPGPSGSSS